jgi:HEAT repeat protein
VHPRKILNSLFPDPPKSSGQTSLDERLIHERLNPLVEALTDPDESRRRAAVEHVVRTCIPAVVGRLIDRLVGLLGGEGVTRGPALASLEEFGARALPSLTLKFTRTRDAALQRGILEALRRIVPGLKVGEQINLLTETLILGRFAADESVSRALARLVAVARRASEAAARTV